MRQRLRPRDYQLARCMLHFAGLESHLEMQTFVMPVRCLDNYAEELGQCQRYVAAKRRIHAIAGLSEHRI